jgi:class 3 adenylate cyclase
VQRGAHGQILTDRRVAVMVGDLAHFEPIGDLTLKGLHRPVPTFVVHSLR